MKAIQSKQINREEIQSIKPNRIDKVQDEYFKEYLKENEIQIPEHEQHMYHVLVDFRLHSQKNGTKISKTNLKKLTPQAFNQLERTDHFKGAITFLLHDPSLKDAKPAAKPLNDENQSLKDQPAKTGAKEPVKEENSISELEEKTNPELIAMLEELTGEKIKGQPKKAELIEQIEYAKAKALYVEKFEEEPADDLSIEQILTEVESAQ